MNDLDEFLEHYGVKGMRWGIRKNYINKKTPTVQRLDRLATGTATGKDRLLGPNIKSVAAKQRDQLQAHLKRLERGEETARDLISLYGSVSVLDLRAARKLAK